jgi:hypothetical protein
LRSTALRICFAARSGVVMATLSNEVPTSGVPPVKAVTLSCTRALRAMFVLMPPGCTVVQETPLRATSSSTRRASVKPRTPNLAAL